MVKMEDDNDIAEQFSSLCVFGLFSFTLGMQGTLRWWMLAPGSAGYLLWECCILASL